MPPVDSAKDAPILNAIVRGAAKASHAFTRADAVEILLALYAMKQADRARLVAQLSHDESKGWPK